MNRLPDFVMKLSPVKEILAALDAEFLRLEQAAAHKNAQLSVQTAEEGLALWEQDYRLLSSGGLSDRRSRILAALTGTQTLTPAALKELALLLGRGDRVELTEQPDEYQVLLQILFEESTPQDLTVLKEVVAQRKPAHLAVEVLSTFPRKELAYLGTATSLRTARRAIGAANAGSYLLFMGGDNAGSSYYSTVDTYDKNLTRGSASALNYTASDGASGSVGGYAVYAGGQNSASEGGMTCANKATAYDKDLVRSAPADLSQKRYRITGASTPTHFLVSPGEFGGARANVDAYDKDLARTTAAAASAARAYVAGATVGEYGLFAGGGFGSSHYANVDVYDADLTRTAGTALSGAKWAVSSASSKRHAFFAGGANPSGTPMADGEVFDADLVKTAIPSLATAAFNHFSASLEGLTAFAGGEGGGSRFSGAECYNENFTKTTLPSLSTAKIKGGSTSPKNSGVIGDHMVFAGGYKGSVVSTTEVYTLVQGE